MGRLDTEDQSLVAESSTLLVGGWEGLHLVGGQVMLWDAVGTSHHSVILVKAPHAVHFVVDAAGDVLNVLHVSPKHRDRLVLVFIFHKENPGGSSETFLRGNKANL